MCTCRQREDVCSCICSATCSGTSVQTVYNIKEFSTAAVSMCVSWPVSWWLVCTAPHAPTAAHSNQDYSTCVVGGDYDH